MTGKSGGGLRCADAHHILLLEDDAVTARLMKTVIEEDLAIAVQIASDGRTALEAIAKSMPLAVLVDLMVPFLDGDTFMQEVRSRYGKLVPLVVVSAAPPAEVKAAATRRGATYITKPFDLSDLVAEVANALAPWLAAALGPEPEHPIVSAVTDALTSDADLLLERSWKVLARAHDSLGRARLMLRLQQRQLGPNG